MSTATAAAPEHFYLTEASFSPALVTRADRDLVDLRRIRRQGDIGRLAVLLESGAIFAIPPHDRVRLVAKCGLLAHVQVVEGEHRDSSGWVRCCDLHPAPDPETPEVVTVIPPVTASPYPSEREQLSALG